MHLEVVSCPTSMCILRLKSDEYTSTDVALKNLSKIDTFQSSITIQIASNYHFQTFPATTGNFSANGHLVRKSDVDDDDVWTKTIMLMMLMIMLIRSCRSY